MTQAARRIDPQEARKHIEDGALLVCGYEADEKCQGIMLDAAIGMRELKTMEKTLPRDQEIIFYCA
jgi:hypothetical protein